MLDAIQLITIVICMIGTAFFAGIETGVISIHRLRLRHFVRQGLPGADILQDLLDDSDRLLGTTLVGTNLFMVVVSVVSASMARRWLHHWGEPVAVFVDTVLILILCEYLPKAWFHSRPLERCRRFAPLLRLSEIVLRPVSRTVIAITRLLVPGSKTKLANAVPFVTRDDLKVLARESEQHGILSPEERVMIHRVFDLSDKRTGDIMIPIDRVASVANDATVTEFFEAARRTGFTRMPVLDRISNAYTGIINVFFVMSYAGSNTDHLVGFFSKPPLFIHEDTPVDDILPKMRRFRQPMALVRNSAEEVVGIVTTEDVLDEIIGHMKT